MGAADGRDDVEQPSPLGDSGTRATTTTSPAAVGPALGTHEHAASKEPPAGTSRSSSCVFSHRVFGSPRRAAAIAWGSSRQQFVPSTGLLAVRDAVRFDKCFGRMRPAGSHSNDTVAKIGGLVARIHHLHEFLDGIAIIRWLCRLPGASSISNLWRLLINGECAIRLRFFLSAMHNQHDIETAVDTILDELQRVRDELRAAKALV